MTSTVSQKFLDDNQYSRKGIKRYEMLFGHTFLSTGGLKTCEELYKLLNLKPGVKILDVGCGVGGSAFYLARTYGAHVLGVDLSSNMIEIANENLNEQEDEIKTRVSFEVADITKKEFEPKSFNVIISRDAILHIEEKAKLFRLLHKWLKPAGQLFITDFGRGHPASEDKPEFRDYIAQRRYHFITIEEYVTLLSEAGFSTLKPTNNSVECISILERELRNLEEKKEELIKTFSQADYEEIEGLWISKMKRLRTEELYWGLFVAVKLDTV